MEAGSSAPKTEPQQGLSRNLKTSPNVMVLDSLWTANERPVIEIYHNSKRLIGHQE
jgi:hypothetical protein